MSASFKHVVLCGMMGTGKSTVGPLLAESLGRPFCDLDDYIVKQSGRDIAAIFAQQGEAGFRVLEGRALEEVLSTPEPMVVALGGGTLNRPGARAALAQHLVVWLDASPDGIWRRIGADSGRPLIAADSTGRDAVVALWQSRRPLYAQTAHWRLDTEGLNPPSVVSAILQWLQEVGEWNSNRHGKSVT